MSVIEELYEGKSAKIYVFKENKNDKPFLMELQYKFPKEYKTLFRRITWLGDMGKINDEQKFKLLQDKIFELKTDLFRVLCFYIEGVKPKVIILSNYFRKCPNRQYKKEIEKAKLIRDKAVKLFNQTG